MKRSLLLMGSFALVAGCTATKMYTLQGSSVVPAAEGDVTVGEGPNGNTKIEVDVNHLASPQNIQPNATGFVVWAISNMPNAVPSNLGMLRVDQDLHGRLKTTTPLTSFNLFVTAEPSPMTATPNGARLLSVQIKP